MLQRKKSIIKFYQWIFSFGGKRKGPNSAGSPGFGEANPPISTVDPKSLFKLEISFEKKVPEGRYDINALEENPNIDPFKSNIALLPPQGAP